MMTLQKFSSPTPRTLPRISGLDNGSNTDRIRKKEPATRFGGCRNPGLNRGHLDLQSNALPTELFRLVAAWRPGTQQADY